MKENLRKLVERLGGEVIEAPELSQVEFSTFGLAKLVELVERLQPSMGKRPGRPTNPEWDKLPKIPMSEETVQILSVLAERFSSDRRKISPMQMAAIIMDDEVKEYKEVFDFMDSVGLEDVWKSGGQTYQKMRNPPERREWVVIEFTGEENIREPFLWKVATTKHLRLSILFAGILEEYGHVVLEVRHSEDSEEKSQLQELQEMVEGHPGLRYFATIDQFIAARAGIRFSHNAVLFKHFQTRPIHRFRFPLAVVRQPYLYHLAEKFHIPFSVVHATIIGSHGYLDVELDPQPDPQLRNPAKVEGLISFARRMGIAVRQVVSKKDFWADLIIDSEEEIRRSLVAARGKHEDWRSLPPKLDQAVQNILGCFRKQYALFPGHHSIGNWLYGQAQTAESSKVVSSTNYVTETLCLQVAGMWGDATNLSTEGDIDYDHRTDAVIESEDSSSSSADRNISQDQSTEGATARDDATDSANEGTGHERWRDPVTEFTHRTEREMVGSI